MQTIDFVVLGAGIQGICIALELAKNNKKVTVLDQDPVPFNRASLRNEGKVHLGLVYVNDPSFATPKLMLQGALEFRKSLERWIGERSYELGLSNNFYYLVSKDSFLNPDELEERYAKMEGIFADFKAQNQSWDYLGTMPKQLTKRVSQKESESLFGKEKVLAAFETAELSVDPELLRQHLVEAMLHHPLITFLPEHKITSLHRQSESILIKGSNPKGSFDIQASQVINATWDGKFELDESLGIPKPEGLLHRLKYRVMVKISPELLNRPSATMVIGKFGDVVIRRDGTAYLSWYPTGCTGWSNSLKPPSSWQNPSKGIISKEEANEYANSYLQEIEKWFPGIIESEPYLVDAGAIVAYGETDVDDKKSRLHDRTNIGLKTYKGNYHSIDAGKLTTAPFFAVESVKSILSKNQISAL